jgi:hypothetical protein
MARTLLPGSIALCTRLGREIVNAQDLDQPPSIVQRLNSGFRTKYGLARLRRSPTGQYNCHGLTFANRRTGIHSPEEVKKVLHDDGYRQIGWAHVEVGDLATYYDAGEIAHTGIVVRVERSGDLIRGQAVWIMSKWGQAGEYIHPAKHGPYAEHELTFWRES